MFSRTKEVWYTADDVPLHWRDWEPPAPAPEQAMAAPRAVAPPLRRRRRPRRFRGHRLQVLVAAIVAVALLVGAYRYTLTRLLDGVTTEPTLAWLVVVLPLSALLVAVHGRPRPQEPAIHDRQLDYLVGVPLLVAALAVVLLLPRQMSTMFWTYRIDVLALPLHAAGLVALLFGTRALWRLRASVGLLAAAWPVPWLLLSDAWVERAPSSEALTVATALCFPVVAGALLTVSAGRRRAKTAWMLAGTVVAVAAAVFVGRALGPVPIHTLMVPVVVLAALLMLAALPVFRLRLKAPSLLAVAPAAPTRTPAVRSLNLPLVIVTLASVAVAQADWRLTRYAGVAGPLGEPRTIAFVTEPPVIPGWTTVADDGVSGPPEQERSTYRYLYRSADPSPLTPPQGAAPLLTVVVTSATAQPSGKAQPPVDPSIDTLPGGQTVELGQGVMADVVSYLDHDTGTVAVTASWSLPVRDARGARYERIALSGEVRDARNTSTAAMQDFVERAAREILSTQIARAGTGPADQGVTT